MEIGFEEHLARVTERLGLQRATLLATLAGLDDADLGRARRGGWTIAKVLEHITGSEWHYARLVRQLRSAEDIPPENVAAASVAESVDALARSRAALLNAIEGVTEDDFYRLGTVGREEYSVVSVLENVEQHDIEHLGQIASIHAERQ